MDMQLEMNRARLVLLRAAIFFNLTLRLTLGLALSLTLGLPFDHAAKAHTKSSLFEPDWSEGFEIPHGGRSNPYELAQKDLDENIHQGRIHALWYPVEETELLVPWHASHHFLNSSSRNPLRRLLQGIVREFTEMRNMDEVWDWLGLHHYPHPDDNPDSGVYSVPYPEVTNPHYRMGVTLMSRANRQGIAEGFTISCAACHSGSLFGKTVLGMTNRFPRANEFFIRGKKASQATPTSLFQFATKATDAEAEMFADLKQTLPFIGLKKPMALGLDTSLPQVALSLAKRAQDEHATKRTRNSLFPRYDILEDQPADSKPAVWWNLKYKNRWLSDGSIVSGNPIFTNILWNEIGRGVDLKKLDNWLSENDEIIQELTTAAFSAEAPRFTDFFPADRIDLAKARQGQAIFKLQCAKCHGDYAKAWDLPHASKLPLIEKLATIEVSYPTPTAVKNVGTDPLRYQGMKSLEKGLNPLAISKTHGIKVESQGGYVPPPLVGIWARWPYFHNNSIPSLCALLTRSEDRPQTYYAGEAHDPERDFDIDCNGYPLGADVPNEWRENPNALFDTSRPAMGNFGHDDRIFLKDGEELLTLEEKMALIQFLQTL
jgi:hypothetical protein